MNVLITGFDPFGGEPINPAWEAVKAMKDEIAGAKITKLQIPTVVNKSIAKVHEKMMIAVKIPARDMSRTFFSIFIFLFPPATVLLRDTMQYSHVLHYSVSA